MKPADKFLYKEIARLIPSQNCEYAGILYCEIIAKIYHKRPDIVHSILRVAVRPIFYLGYSDSDTIILWLEYKLDKTKIIQKFLAWLRKEENLLKTCLEELKICSDFYDLKYSELNNLVILKDDYGKITEFKFFQDFKNFYVSKFDYLKISEEEIERIMEEEKYIKEFEKIK